MKELASRGEIEQDALIQYVIDGIQDDMQNKIILFGTKNQRDFKERLKIYEDIRRKGRDQMKNSKGKDDATRRANSGKRTVDVSKGTTDASKKTTERKDAKSDVRCYNCGAKGHISKDCGNKSLGKRCFKCQAFGHTAAECEKKGETKESASVQTCDLANNIAGTSKVNMCKDIVVNNVRVKALIDTGSQVTVLREDIFIDTELPMSQLRNTDTLLIGFGKNETRPLGYFQTIVQIDGGEFPSTVYVVPTSLMSVGVVVGCDILSSAEVKIDTEGIQIRKIPLVKFLTQIRINDEQIDVGHVEDVKMRERLENLIVSYVPKETKTTDIKMRLVLKDETPICQKPRRLPVPERDVVSKQVDDWIREGVIHRTVFV
ncbi:PREDICTED: uncharacterized protein LOC105557527 [Vollenhovia emeryi]|uniref:uncharacterized protein LOC105557527 n=1 Tax=Vollenhovia emeryi TaxID=411798 RepID=UPI0005F54235|nr:PREDICTED: uncharacterized protein LOC105557527 [Vollenhovia emeryi]